MIITLLQSHGEVPPGIKEKISEIEDPDILGELVKKAAGGASIEEFETVINQAIISPCIVS